MGALLLREDMGFLSNVNARREAAAAQRREEQQTAATAAREERAAVARESELSADELASAWEAHLASADVDLTRVRLVVDGSRGTVLTPAMDISDAVTDVGRGVVVVTDTRRIAFAFRKATYGDGDPAMVEVKVRRFDEIREPRKKEDRSFYIVFERDRLFTPQRNPMQGDAWELRTGNPDELRRRFSDAGLPW